LYPKGRKWQEAKLDSSDSEEGPMVGSCEYGNEPSDYIKGRAFLG